MRGEFAVQKLHGWGLGPPQVKALGQVLLSFGVAASISFISMLFMPPPNMPWYSVLLRVFVLTEFAILSLWFGLLLHWDSEASVPAKSGKKPRRA